MSNTLGRKLNINIYLYPRRQIPEMSNGFAVRSSAVGFSSADELVSAVEPALTSLY